MIEEVKELIERVKLTPEEIKEAIYKDSKSKVNWTQVVTPRDYKVAQAQLNKVLNDPDLALIIGGIHEIIGGGADPEAYVASGVGVSWERSAPVFGEFKRAGYKQVIPLADAIKEIK